MLNPVTSYRPLLKIGSLDFSRYVFCYRLRLYKALSFKRAASKAVGFISERDNS